MKIAVVGTGYVGLVAGVCFADAGHKVTCVDQDPKKIALLKDGIIPIYEPGLEDVMNPAVRAGRLHFTTDLKSAMEGCSVVFIAVGTPENADGSADLRATFEVARQIGTHASQSLFVVLKSTVPVGTSSQVQDILRSASRFPCEVVNNPEFLKEGTAVEDFLKPDRIVIGCRTEEARATMQELYSPFVKNGHPIFFMDNTSAELTKYAANAFLSVKISFINELARLADRVGADINKVRQGFTTDRRINPAFFYPGVGFGGSCFPKDTKALVSTGEQVGIPMRITDAAQKVNALQKHYLFELMQKYFGSLEGKHIALWGLAFKPRTDDVREAPSLTLIEDLTKAGAKVRAFDPVAQETAKAALGREAAGAVTMVNSSLEALDGADALAVVTEWNEFRAPDFAEIKSRLKTPVVFDGRNVYDPAQMKTLGFTYFCIGRQVLFDSTHPQRSHPLEGRTK